MFYLIILAILGCNSGFSSQSNTNNIVGEPREDNLQIASTNIVNRNDNLKLSLKSNLIVGGETTGEISSSGEDITISSITSLSGNIVTLLGNNTFKFKDTKGLRTDLLTVTYREGSNESKTEVLEIRTAKNSKLCLGIYLAGDNDLGGGEESYSGSYDFVRKDLNELVGATFNEADLQIIVLLDRNTLSDRYFNETVFSKTGLYIIENGNVTLLREISEPDMGNHKVLTYFLNAMKGYCNADKYILDLWSHGFSIFGVGFDDSHNSNSLTPYELRIAITESDLPKLNIVLFSACLMMDLGVLGELKDCVEATTGSPDSVPGDGSAYSNNGIIGAIISNKNNSSVQIANAICTSNFNSYINGYQQGGQSYLIFSAVDQSKINSVMIALKNLLVDSNNNLRFSYNDIFTTAITNSSVFYGASSYTGTNYKGDIIDLGSLANSIVTHYSDNAIKSLATALLTEIKNCITSVHHIRTETEFNTDYIGLGILYKETDQHWSDSTMMLNSVYNATGWNKLMNVN